MNSHFGIHTVDGLPDQSTYQTTRLRWHSRQAQRWRRSISTRLGKEVCLALRLPDQWQAEDPHTRHLSPSTSTTIPGTARSTWRTTAESPRHLSCTTKTASKKDSANHATGKRNNCADNGRSMAFVHGVCANLRVRRDQRRWSPGQVFLAHVRSEQRP